MRVGVVVTAAGSGERLGAAVPKALVAVGGRTLLEHAVTRALSVADDIVVTAPESSFAEFAAAMGGASVSHALGEEADRRTGFRPASLAQPTDSPARSARGTRALSGDAVRVETSHGRAITIVTGGETRQESVRAGLAALGDVDLVLVHDAARAFAPAALFHGVVAALRDGHAAVIPALPVVDTIKRADSTMRVTGTMDRSELWAVQTPQGFRRELLERAHVASAGADATDDAALVESLGEPVQLIPGHEDAFKVTTPRDVLVAEALLSNGFLIE